MADLKTNYKDDILDTSQNTKRKYDLIENQDGTYSLDDETAYTQEGDSFGASDINATNTQVNTNTGAIQTLNSDLDKLYLSNDMNYTFLNQSIDKNSYYEAPVDGQYFFNILGSSGGGAMLYLDNERTKRIAEAWQNIQNTVILYLKKDTKIYTRANFGEYTVTGYITH